MSAEGAVIKASAAFHNAEPLEVIDAGLDLLEEDSQLDAIAVLLVSIADSLREIVAALNTIAYPKGRD